MKKILFYLLFVSATSWSMDTLDQGWRFKAQFLAHHFCLHHSHSQNNQWMYDEDVDSECHKCSYNVEEGVQAFEDTMNAINTIKVEPYHYDNQTSS